MVVTKKLFFRRFKNGQGLNTCGEGQANRNRKPFTKLTLMNLNARKAQKSKSSQKKVLSLNSIFGSQQQNGFMMPASPSLNSTTTSPLPPQPLSPDFPPVPCSKAAIKLLHKPPPQTLESTTTAAAVSNREILHYGRVHNSNLVGEINSYTPISTPNMTPLLHSLPPPLTTLAMVPPPLPSMLHKSPPSNYQLKTTITQTAAAPLSSSTITSTAPAAMTNLSIPTPMNKPEILEPVKIINSVPLPSPMHNNSSSSFFKQRVNTFHNNPTQKIVHHTLNTMATTAFSAQPKPPVVLKRLKLIVPKKRKRSPPKRNESKIKRHIKPNKQLGSYHCSDSEAGSDSGSEWEPDHNPEPYANYSDHFSDPSPSPDSYELPPSPDHHNQPSRGGGNGAKQKKQEKNYHNSPSSSSSQHHHHQNPHSHHQQENLHNHHGRVIDDASEYHDGGPLPSRSTSPECDSDSVHSYDQYHQEHHEGTRYLAQKHNQYHRSQLRVAPSGRERIASDSFAQRPRFRPNRMRSPVINENYHPEQNNGDQQQDCQKNPNNQPRPTSSSNTQPSSISSGKNNCQMPHQNHSSKSKINSSPHNGQRNFPCYYCPEEFHTNFSRNCHLDKCYQLINEHLYRAYTHFNFSNDIDLTDLPISRHHEGIPKIKRHIVLWASYSKIDIRQNIICFEDSLKHFHAGECIRTVADLAIIVSRCIKVNFGKNEGVEKYFSQWVNGQYGRILTPIELQERLNMYREQRKQLNQMIQSVAHIPEALGLIVEYLQNLNDEIIAPSEGGVKIITERVPIFEYPKIKKISRHFIKLEEKKGKKRRRS